MLGMGHIDVSREIIRFLAKGKFSFGNQRVKAPRRWNSRLGLSTADQIAERSATGITRDM